MKLNLFNKRSEYYQKQLFDQQLVERDKKLSDKSPFYHSQLYHILFILFKRKFGCTLSIHGMNKRGLKQFCF
jgi:hypothetical protein